MGVFNFESQSEFKRTKYVIQFSQYPKNPHKEKRIPSNNNILANTCCA
jgi:hypothetical protein